jgi:mono/diheme cytochrome c family protein
MTSRTITTTVLALLPLASGCFARSMSRDVDQVQQRYPHIYKQDQCSSWLRSYKTGHKYCASPYFAVAVEAPAAAAPKVDETKTDKASLVARGEVVYGQVCAACHQANGQGVPGAFPPLAGAGDYYGDPQNHARIIVHGLQGEIVVNGVTYNGAMPPQGSLSDYDIAAVATYERFSWGNSDGIVMPDDVKAVR